MNKVILIGRLTKDVDTREGNGKMIASYTLAVDRKFKQEGNPDADFIRCTCWGKTAEFADKYLRKGTKILVQGRIQTGSYTDKEGRKVYTTDVIVEEHEFVESKASQTTTENAAEGFMEVPAGFDEELPFA